jgi:Reverse transcriptase (RNA-dependent DNA polymerase)
MCVTVFMNSCILQALSRSQVLSALDALSGFHQMTMEDKDKEKTTFCSHQGLWQFKQMPFGLRNGPSIFQRMMQSILAPFLWTFSLVYIDDIVVYSKSYKEHLDHLDQVLGACAEAHLTLVPKKCHFMYMSILLLGQKVSRLGLSTHKEKIKVVIELACPHNQVMLQTFLGMAVYFSHFVPHYSE